MLFEITLPHSLQKGTVATQKPRSTVFGKNTLRKEELKVFLEKLDFTYQQKPLYLLREHTFFLGLQLSEVSKLR